MLILLKGGYCWVDFRKVQNKDSFNEGRKLGLFLEINHLNTLSLNDFVNWQLMKVWSMESSSFNEGSNLELFLELNHLNTVSLNDFVNWQLMKVSSMESSSPQKSITVMFISKTKQFFFG